MEQKRRKGKENQWREHEAELKKKKKKDYRNSKDTFKLLFKKRIHIWKVAGK